MNKLRFLSGLLGLLLVCPAVFSEDQETDETQYIDVPSPPELPKRVVSGEVLKSEQPEVRTIQRNNTIITEYRLNDHVYMTRIQPEVGNAYYLLDRDGDGDLESRVNDIYQDVALPQWNLISW